MADQRKVTVYNQEATKEAAEAAEAEVQVPPLPGEVEARREHAKFFAELRARFEADRQEMEMERRAKEEVRARSEETLTDERFKWVRAALKYFSFNEGR